MDYTDALKAIIKADGTAKELDESSKKLQEEYPRALERRLAEKKAEFQARVDSRVKKTRETEESFKTQQLEELCKAFEADSARLEAIYEQNKEKYSAAVFEAMRGGRES